MKISFSPLDLIADAAGMFTAWLGWFCSVWMPLVLIAVFFVVGKEALSDSWSLFFILVAVFISLGMILIWAASGVFAGKPVRASISIVFFLCFFLVMCFGSAPDSGDSDRFRFDRSLDAIVMLVAAVGAALGVARACRGRDG